MTYAVARRPAQTDQLAPGEDIDLVRASDPADPVSPAHLLAGNGLSRR